MKYTFTAQQHLDGFGDILMQQVGGGVGGAIGGAISGLAGMALQPLSNAMQIGQQQKLTNMQLAANEQLSQFNFGQQLKMWQDTNYPAQVQQLNQAGLNPALLYGKGGGGGTTTGTPSGGIGMGIAPGSSPAQNAQLALQAQETAADVKLKEAQAANVQATTPGAAGLQEAQTLNLLQGVQNAQAQAALTKAQTIGQNINNEISNATSPDQIAKIRADSSQAQQQFDIIARNNWLDSQTLQTKINQFNASLLKTYAETALIKSNAQVNQSTIAVNQQEIAKWANDMVQSAAQQSTNRMNATTASDNAKTTDNMYQLTKQMYQNQQFDKPLDDFMQGLQGLIPHFITPIGKMQPPRNPVGFKY